MEGLRIFAVILFLILFLFVFFWPIRKAKKKNLSKDRIRIIRVLTWLGLFKRSAWFIALCLSFICEGNIDSSHKDL